MVKKLPAKISEKKVRLDVFLAEKLSISRASAASLIKNNMVTINGNLPKKAGDRITDSDKVEVLNATENLPKDQEPVATTPVFGEPRVVVEHKDFLVVDKPSGMLTHELDLSGQSALSSWVLARYPEIAKVGESRLRPGIVHRLDKEASGLLVVARNNKMFKHLKEQFRGRLVKKKYKTLVYGNFSEFSGEIDFALDRKKDGRMAARPKIDLLKVKNVGKEQMGKEALTRYQVLRENERFSYVDVRILTGRMHQIRAHFFALGRPLVGDRLYKNTKLIKKKELSLPRLFLHAYHLEFSDLKGERVRAFSELPKELLDFIGEISLKSVLRPADFAERLSILSGPSGSGQDTVIRELAKELPLDKVVTSTTRSPRPGEVNGADYYFLSEKDFLQKIKKGEFYEWARQYNDNYYGVGLAELVRVAESGKIGIWKMDFQGVIKAKELFPGIKAVLLTAPFEILEKRLREREKNATEKYIAERMAYTKEYLDKGHLYDIVVENKEGKLAQTVEKVKKFLLSTEISDQEIAVEPG